MTTSRFDPVSLTGGLALLALGVLLLLDQTGALELSFNLLAAAVSAAIGTILLVDGVRNGGG